MHQVSPELFRKVLPEMKENELKLLAILYETEDHVPDSSLQSEMGLNGKQLGSVFGWFKIRIHEKGGSMPYRSDCFPNHEANGEWHYCLIDHLRPVVGEFLMRKQINELFNHFKASARVILVMNKSIDDLFEHIRSQEKILDSLLEISDLDDEMHEELSERILKLQHQSLKLRHKTITLDEDQTDIASDAISQLNNLDQKLQHVAHSVHSKPNP